MTRLSGGKLVAFGIVVLVVLQRFAPNYVWAEAMNVAQDKPASWGTSQPGVNLVYEEPDYLTPDKAVDGDLGFHSRWVADDFGTVSDPIWLQVDLGQPFCVERVVLWNVNGISGFYETFNLKGSLDGSGWTNLQSGTLTDFSDDHSPYRQEIAADGVPLRYIRFEVTGGTHFAHLTELEVYSIPEPSALAALLGLGGMGLLRYKWRRRCLSIRPVRMKR